MISPLVALMADQLQHLPPLLPGGLINSSQVWNLSLYEDFLLLLDAELHYNLAGDTNGMFICVQTTAESTEVMSRLLSGQIKVRFRALVSSYIT